MYQGLLEEADRIDYEIDWDGLGCAHSPHRPAIQYAHNVPERRPSVATSGTGLSFVRSFATALIRICGGIELQHHTPQSTGGTTGQKASKTSMQPVVLVHTEPSKPGPTGHPEPGTCTIVRSVAPMRRAHSEGDMNPQKRRTLGVPPRRHWEAMVTTGEVFDTPVPQSPKSAPSPQTITDPLVSMPHTAVCQRPPYGNAKHRALMVKAVYLLNKAFRDLVRVGHFPGYDVTDHQPPGCRQAFEQPEQDPFGALSAAVTMARYLMRPDMLDEHGLDVHVRTLLATCLFMCYKVKSETQYDLGTHAQIVVISRFLNENEIPKFGWNNDKHHCKHYEDIMWRLEGNILNTQPVFQLIDNNPQVGCEIELTRMLHSEPPLITNAQACLVLAATNYFLNAAVTNPEVDLVEDLGRTLSAPQIGSAVAIIGVTALLGRIPYAVVDEAILTAASRMAMNATAMGDDARIGAYLDWRSPVWDVVGTQALPRAQFLLDERLARM